MHWRTELALTEAVSQPRTTQLIARLADAGLVEPILPAISHDLDATPSQVTLLFTSYLVITALAGTSDSIGGIVGCSADSASRERST